MLDENLPAFFLRPSSTGLKHHRDLFLTHHGSDPAPAYTVRHADPASSSLAHKNCYAAALFDAYNPEVLFGEVLARPGWTHPSLSAEELRRNGGVPPPPQPILPSEFIVQLYNPDQQIRVELKEGKWGASDSYEFSMPISTFRTPSASNLDRGQSDPAGLATTPKLFFAWRKESKLSKDLTCYMTGRSTDTTKKKSNRKDPDIAVALWRSMRELTIYEPNISRLDMEDPKGLEVAFLLSAVVIKDLYFSSKDHLREVFNVSEDPTGRKLSAGGRKLSNPQNTSSINGKPAPVAPNHPSPPVRPNPQSANDVKRQSLPKLQTTPPKTPNSGTQPAPPAADPRAQWELDAETARLKAQAENEAKEQRRRRREREKADEAEAKRLQRMADEETKVARRKQADVEKETERLRKQYGVQPIPQRHGPPQANSSSSRQHRQQPPRLQPIPQRSEMNLQPPPQNASTTQRPSASSSNLAMSGANPSASHINLSAPSRQKPKQKKSFFGLRNVSEEGQQGGSSTTGRLKKKQSSFW